jgi:hydantoinase/carbamoylase family amidase
MDVPAIDGPRVLAELGELEELTGGPNGADRVCWDEGWALARRWLTGKLAELGIEPEIDEAGNLWAYLEPGSGAGDRAGRGALTLGSHLDSVPNGGRLDGALGVVAALGVLRAWAEAGLPDGRELALVDFADEEGSRFGRSLFGSSAVAGTLDPAELADLRDAEGHSIGAVLAASGVELERAPEAASRLDRVGAYLELHIEQGPVLDSEGASCCAVSGCAGVERLRLHFAGQTSHSGTTPMDMRRDAALAAAETALAVEAIARESGGVGTTGELALRPAIITAVAGEADLGVDLRHPEAGALASMLERARSAAGKAAEAHGCELTESPVWRIEPIPFDAGLVEVAADACASVGGRAEPLPSGALHDAAEIARRVPAAMIFAASRGGISHAPEEDSAEPDLLAAIEAYGRLAAAALAA